MGWWYVKIGGTWVAVPTTEQRESCVTGADGATTCGISEGMPVVHGGGAHVGGGYVLSVLDRSRLAVVFNAAGQVGASAKYTQFGWDTDIGLRFGNRDTGAAVVVGAAGRYGLDDASMGHGLVTGLDFAHRLTSLVAIQGAVKVFIPPTTLHDTQVLATLGILFDLGKESVGEDATLTTTPPPTEAVLELRAQLKQAEDRLAAAQKPLGEWFEQQWFKIQKESRSPSGRRSDTPDMFKLFIIQAVVNWLNDRPSLADSVVEPLPPLEGAIGTEAVRALRRVLIESDDRADRARATQLLKTCGGLRVAIARNMLDRLTEGKGAVVTILQGVGRSIKELGPNLPEESLRLWVADYEMTWASIVSVLDELKSVLLEDADRARIEALRQLATCMISGEPCPASADRTITVPELRKIRFVDIEKE